MYIKLIFSWSTVSLSFLFDIERKKLNKKGHTSLSDNSIFSHLYLLSIYLNSEPECYYGGLLDNLKYILNTNENNNFLTREKELYIGVDLVYV